MDSGSSCLRDSDIYSGRNGIWMTNRDSLLASSIQCSSLTVMVMVLSMNPSIDASMAMISTAMGSASERWFVGCYISSFGSKVLFGELKSAVS